MTKHEHLTMIQIGECHNRIRRLSRLAKANKETDRELYKKILEKIEEVKAEVSAGCKKCRNKIELIFSNPLTDRALDGLDEVFEEGQ